MSEHAGGQLLFTRILCGVDETPESRFAVEQAMRLRDTEGVVSLTTAADMAKAVHAGYAATHAAELLQRDAEAALAAARPFAPGAEERLVHGEPAAVLLQEAETEGVTLIAVGSHGRSRIGGMLLGTVAARILHEAPCSVLIARAPRHDPEKWPDALAVGVDGSAESAAAYTAARSVAERLGASIRVVAGTQDAFDHDAARAIAPEIEEHDARAADVLETASEVADLVVVGSRGLQGLKSLGSVSERIAYRVGTSVLVVRPPRSTA